MANLEEIEKKLELILQKQQELENKFDKIEMVMSKIESDIYEDDCFDFEIVCPYCNNEFVIDLDDDKTEIKCPECDNVIELDWTGDLDGCGHEGCGGCHGCGHDDDDDM